MSPEDQRFLVGFAIFLIVLIIATYFILQARFRAKGRVKIPLSADQVECPRCGVTIKRGLDYCDSCGADLRDDSEDKEGPRCPVCSAPLDKGVKKCGACGHDLEKDKAPVAQEGFVCPKCGKPVAKDAKKCSMCKEEFWAPVRPATGDVPR